MHTLAKRGLGLLVLTSLVAACAAHADRAGDKSADDAAPTDETAAATVEALGEMACTNLGVTAPITPTTGKVIATQTNGCKLQAAVISSNVSYGIDGCPNQYLLNLTHVTSTANNPVRVVPHANISPTDCPNTFVTLGIYARDDHQNNPWTLLGTTSTAGTVSAQGWCSWDSAGKNQLKLPATTAYTSIMIAASAYTNTYWKGVATPNNQLVGIFVDPTCP